MATAGIARYAVKSLTLTFAGTAYEAAGLPAMKGETKEAVDVTALTDQVKRFIAGAVKETDEFTVTLYQKGSSDITVDATPGALSLALVLENGVDADVTASVAYARVIVTKVAPPTIDAPGDRKATYDVTFRPDGSAAAQASE